MQEENFKYGSQKITEQFHVLFTYDSKLRLRQFSNEKKTWTVYERRSITLAEGLASSREYEPVHNCLQL